MNPARILGGIALAVGGGLLLSDFFLGQTVLTEMTDTPWAVLRLLGGTLAGSGLVAIGLGVREIKELSQSTQKL